MPLVLTSGPAAEPVTVAEAKAYCRIDGTAEDALVASLILTSRLHIETALGMALITQGFELQLDAWPGAAVALPIRPLQAVSAVRVLNDVGDVTLVPAESYSIDAASATPRLVSRAGSWPAPGRRLAGISIDLTAGYGASPADVPAPIRQALLMLVAHWYEHRDPVEVGSQATRIPIAVSDLLLPYRIKRL